MGIFKKDSLRKVLKIVLVLLVIGGVGYSLYYFRDNIREIYNSRVLGKTVNTLPLKKLGVVDYDKLIMTHPQYSTLQKLDEEISQLGPNPFDPTELQKFNDELNSKMVKYQKQMEDLLIKEQQSISAEAENKAKALESEFQSIYIRKQQELENYQEQLRKDYEDKQADPNRELSSWEKKFQEKLSRKAEDLLTLKESQLAAKRLELEKKSQERIVAYQRELTEELKVYEEQIMAQNQEAKVNLQLKLNAAGGDEAERQELQEQLEVILNREAEEIDRKRQENDSKVQAVRSEELSKNEAELKKYESRLNADVSRQLEGYKQEISDELYKEGVRKGENIFVPKDIQAKLSAKQEQLRREMEALQGEMQSKVRVLQEEAEARFNVKKNEMIKKMEDYHKSLSAEFERKKNEMLKTQENANTERDQVRNQLIQQRSKLYDSMIEDINRVVGEMAKEKRIPLVVGKCIVNISAEDLGKEAEDSVKNLKNSKNK